MEILLITLSLCIIVLAVSVSYFLFYSSKAMKAIVKYCDTKNNEVLVKIVELYKEIIDVYDPGKIVNISKNCNNTNMNMEAKDESTGLYQTPYADYWYLREGDFRPEPVKGIFNGNGCCKKFIEEMKDLGNLFPTREEAAKASDDIRAYLHSKYGKHP